MPLKCFNSFELFMRVKNIYRNKHKLIIGLVSKSRLGLKDVWIYRPVMENNGVFNWYLPGEKKDI
jgi:hypothetical protein